MNQRLPVINLLSYIGLIVVNFLAVKIPYFGRTPGDVSDLYPNLLTPPSFAFNIWSFIYALLGIFTIYQAKSIYSKKKVIPTEVSATGLLFLVTCVLNFGWLLAWQAMYITWSFVLIFILWILLILIYYRLAILEKAVWQFTVPFSFYLAWVCVAALGNLNVMLIDLGFDFFGLTEEYWTASLIGIGIGGTLLVLYLNEDLWFTLVLMWAFFGIYVKNRELSEDGNWVITMSLTAIVVLLVAGSWVGWKKWNRKNQ